MVNAVAKYQKYTEYKDSGVEWLGKIPSHWDMWKLSHAYNEIGSGTTPSTSNEENFEGDIPWITTGELRENVILDTKKKVSKKTIDQFPTLKKYPVGSVAIAMYGATIGRLGIFGIEATTNQACCVMTTSNVLNNKYLFYWLQAFKNEIIQLSSGGGQPNINQEKVASLKVSAPLIDDQIKIANFLDHETAKIDTLIAKQEKLIELLKEKRQAVISNLVAVQNNEPTIKLKYAVEILAGYSFSSAGFQIENDNGIPLLRGINVGVGSIKWDECVWWSKSDTNGLERYLLQEGDLVFGMDRPWISSGARVAEIKQTDLPSYLVQRVARIRCIDGFYQPYVKLVLGSKEFKSFIESDLTGVSVPHISTDQIISFEVRNLTYEQQVFETDKVIGFMFQVEELIDKAQSAIQLMQERRTALISSAVTGKIDVRHHASHPSGNDKKQKEGI